MDRPGGQERSDRPTSSRESRSPRSSSKSRKFAPARETSVADLGRPLAGESAYSRRTPAERLAEIVAAGHRRLGRGGHAESREDDLGLVVHRRDFSTCWTTARSRRSLTERSRRSSRRHHGMRRRPDRGPLGGSGTRSSAPRVWCPTRWSWAPTRSRHSWPTPRWPSR